MNRRLLAWAGLPRLAPGCGVSRWKRLLRTQRGQVAAASEQLSAFQLTRYLDYCSEMLALTSKIAVLYVQRFDDQVMISAVNEIEDLTAGLSRKIGQKLMILQIGQGAMGKT